MTRHHPAARHAESRPAISEETGRGAKIMLARVLINRDLFRQSLAAANDVCPLDYEEFIGAKKHLVLGSLSNSGAPQRSNHSVDIG
jgi:hypothetical protein